MTIGFTWRRTARRIKRLKEGVLTISPDYSDPPTSDFLALSHKREHLHLVSGHSCLDLLCVHIQLALIECLFTRENYVSTHRWCSLLSIRCFNANAIVGQALVPPSTVRFAPVMYDASGPATNATNAVTSSTDL
jgi:hypothetical protein